VSHETRVKAVVLDGVVLGLGFGLLGVGMTLVFGLAGVLNLAYGQIVVAAAIVASLLIERGHSQLLAALVGVLAAIGIAVLLDLTLLQAVYRQHGEERVLLGLLLTLGVAFVIGGLLTWRYPANALFIFISGDPISILGVPMAVGAVWASVIALGVAAVLLVFFGLTTFGRGIRSVIQDETGARLVGISPAFVRTVVFALSGALAGIVAVTQSMSGQLVEVNKGFELTTFALIVAVVGGLGSVTGAFLAGVLLGVVQALSAHYIGQYYTTIILLGAAALTILVRPRGLLGR
jgi:branched-chain amino acid transport system permease protein